MTIYSQKNPIWKDELLGNSNLTIGSYGCLVTCLAMIIDNAPNIVNIKLKTVNGFVGALVIWNKIQPAFSNLKFVWRSAVYDNNAVLSQIKRNGFCVVQATNRFSKGTHWVLFIGNKRLLDPATGIERSTGVYSNLLWKYSGFAAIDRV